MTTPTLYPPCEHCPDGCDDEMDHFEPCDEPGCPGNAPVADEDQPRWRLP